jgi:hypothetical protein
MNRDTCAACSHLLPLDSPKWCAKYDGRPDGEVCGLHSELTRLIEVRRRVTAALVLDNRDTQATGEPSLQHLKRLGYDGTEPVVLECARALHMLTAQDVDVEEEFAPDVLALEAEEVEEVAKDRASGRNDPCPCGSGKKYKKCCLQ